MPRSVFWVCALLLLACGCSSGPRDIPFETTPVTRPTVPAQYVSPTVVVPAELVEKVAAIANGTSGIDWNSVDPRTLDLDWRRARIYHTFSDEDAYPSGIRLRTFGDDRSAADALARGIQQGFGWPLGDYWYSAAEQRGHYPIYAGNSNGFPTIGELAWLADWLLSHYPSIVADVLPFIYRGHGQGGGGDV